MSYILSLDLGTTNVRAVLFDEEKRVVSSGEEELTLYYPRPGWVEQDPLEMVKKQLTVARSLLKNGSINKDLIAGIGITNQRETTILWDKSSGEPIGNAIVWQDRRTMDICDTIIKNGNRNFIHEKTGLVIDPYFSASKIKWLLDKNREIRRKALEGDIAFGTVDSWLLWNLTEGKIHATDITNASRTMLFNIHNLEWDNELLDLWGIPKAILPNVVPSTGPFGSTSLITGKSLRISGMAGDQQAALLGQMCFKPGEIKCTYGTGCFALLNVGERAIANKSGLLTTIGYSDESSVEYALEASVFMGGAIVQWLRDGLGIIETSEEVEELASKVADSNGVVLVPAFTGLGAPHWDPSARGTVLGLTRETNKYHIARAALEGIAWQVSDVVDSMVQSSQIDINYIQTDGGASENDLLMQIQADFMQKSIHRSKHKETTALGAALFASLGAGIYKTREEIPLSIVTRDIFRPNIDAPKRDAIRKVWLRAVERSLRWET